VKDANEEDAAWLKAAEAADAIVGLLFAAYKNTSIAICQSVLCTLESSKAESISSKARTEAVKYFQDVSKRCSAMEALSQCDVIEKISLETLRLTAPAMGDVKQVVDPDGWKIPVDAGSTSDDAWMDSPEKDGKSTKKVKKSSAGDGKADKQAERFFRVPEGLFVAVSPIVSHRDTAKWGPNASEFDPFRSNPGVVAAYSNQSLHVNFSHGIYTTIGPEIPMMMMKLALVVLFGKYDLKLPAGHTVPPLSFTQDTFAQRKGKCFLSIVPKST
jgi:cytochrome P450